MQMIEINARVNISAVVRVLFKIGEKAIVRKRYYSMYIKINAVLLGQDAPRDKPCVT